MDGTLGSQTALMLDGSGVRITSGEELAEIVRAGAEARFPGRGARDRRPREPRGARRVRADARRSGSRSGCATGSSMRSCSPRRTCRASRSSASPRRCSSRTRRPTATSPTASGRGKTDGAYAYRSLVDSGAVVANGSDAPIEELDPLAGIRAGVRRTIDEREAWHPEQALTVQQAFEATTARAGVARGDERRRGKLLPGLRRRSRRARPRPVGRPRRGGRRDDGRRPLGAQPAALGLTPTALRLGSARSGRWQVAACSSDAGQPSRGPPSRPRPGGALPASLESDDTALAAAASCRFGDDCSTARSRRGRFCVDLIFARTVL